MRAAFDRQGPEAGLESADHRGRDRGRWWKSDISGRCRTTCSSTERPRKEDLAKIAFIDLDDMGGPMAANLAKAQHHETAFDLSDDGAQYLAVEKGAHKATSATPGDRRRRRSWSPCCRRASMCARSMRRTCCPTSPGETLLIDCSTIDVDSARHVAAILAEQGRHGDDRRAGVRWRRWR